MRSPSGLLLPSTAIAAGAAAVLGAAGWAIPTSLLAGAFGFLAGQLVAKLRGGDHGAEGRRDALTGLLDRDATLVQLSAWQRAGTPYALLLLDLDHFKPINDRDGHAAGDAVLREIGRRLRLVIRDSDVAARIGGDEFLIALRDVSDRSVARRVRGDIERALDEPVLYDGRFLRVSASLGLAMVPEDTRENTVAIKLADDRMYRRKRLARATSTAHRMTVIIADPDPESRRRLARCFGESHQIIEATDVEQALADATLNRCDLVIASDALPNRGAIRLLAACRAIEPHARRILVTGTRGVHVGDATHDAGVFAVVPREFAETVLPALSELRPRALPVLRVA